MRELGYRENEDFVLGVRFTQGDLGALAGAARQLVAAGANVILVDHDDSAKAARQASQQIPIVCTSLSDPVEQGLIQSFAKPGGNLTGISDLHLELGPKRVEVFRAMIAVRDRRAGILSDRQGRGRPPAVADQGRGRCGLSDRAAPESGAGAGGNP